MTVAYPAFSFQNPLDLYDFSASETSGSWIIDNDGVMGGVSRSQLSFSSTGTILFQGSVSFDFGGGFTSVRSVFETVDAGNYNGLLIMVKGDGKTYQLRVWHQKQFDGVAFFQHFETTRGEWLEIFLPFICFQASYRDRLLPDHPTLNRREISQIGLMVSDKQKGEFSL
ncbi:MAG: CIA30 family protein [Deltaproteobacteria bacterium]|nr:CIA30 family protein [Deltaproteobacteria bacterium]